MTAMGKAEGGPLRGVGEQGGLSWWLEDYKRGLSWWLGDLTLFSLPFDVYGSLHLSHVKMLQKASSVALATPAAASLDGAALHRM